MVVTCGRGGEERSDFVRPGRRIGNPGADIYVHIWSRRGGGRDPVVANEQESELRWGGQGRPPAE